MKNKMVMSLAVGGCAITLAILTVVPLAGNTTIKLAQATGTSYSASFNGTKNPLTKLVQQLSFSEGTVYNASSSTNHNFYYAAYISGGTGLVNNSTAIGGGSGLFAVLNNTSNTNAAEMVLGFAMNGITKIRLDHYWASVDATSVTFSTSLTGYTTAMPTTWTAGKPITPYNGFWGYDQTIDSTGSSNYQALKVQILVPAGGEVGVNVAVSWAC